MLASVVGIVLVSGATLLYAQAKQQAGNTRAKAKVIGCQAVIERYAAYNGGQYPDPLTLYNAWVKERPGDYNQSPWGGPAGPGTDGSTVQQQGFVGSYQALPAVRGANFFGTFPMDVGCITYDPITAPGTGSSYDFAGGQQVPYGGYWVAEIAPDGSEWWFVQGGK